MIIQDEIIIKDKAFYTITLKLPKTTFLIVGNDIGFFMCGALDVAVYDTPKLKERKVICGKTLGVKTIDDLLNAKLVEVSNECLCYHISEGMLVKDALLLIS